MSSFDTCPYCCRLLNHHPRGINAANPADMLCTASGALMLCFTYLKSGTPLPPSLSPTQGLDPASRRNLWDVVKSNKANRAIVLTTHSMEEAEMLCDRLGIFVDGRLVCIGNPKEITRRYGGFLVS